MPNRPNFVAAVFDPAQPKEGNYWQWSSIAIDSAWNVASETINNGWPLKVGRIDDQSAVLLGVLDEGPGSRWFYRIYPGGRDRFNRLGRYFLVLFRLHSPEEVFLPEVAGLLNYFDKERSLPLNTTPLDRAIPRGQPDALLLKLHHQWVNGQHEVHWGMDGTGIRTVFSPRLVNTSDGNNSGFGVNSLLGMGFPRRRDLLIGIPLSLVLGLLGGAALGYHRGYMNGAENGYNRGKVDGHSDYQLDRPQTLPTSTNAVKPKLDK